jgi:hypothetical protein
MGSNGLMGLDRYLLAGCSERPSSKAAASEEAKRTLWRTLSL